MPKPKYEPPVERALPTRVVQCDLGLCELGSDLSVGPVPAVAPVVGFAHGAIAPTIERRRGVADALDHDVREVAERGPEQVRTAQFEISARGLHGGNLSGVR